MQHIRTNIFSSESLVSTDIGLFHTFFLLFFFVVGVIIYTILRA